MVLEVFYIPCPDDGSAGNLIAHLLAKKLIACGNVVTAKSLYTWEGAMVSENEHIAVMKSIPALAVIIESEVKAVHPYSVPAVIHWQANCNKEYFEWLLEQLKEQNAN